MTLSIDIVFEGLADLREEAGRVLSEQLGLEEPGTLGLLSTDDLVALALSIRSIEADAYTAGVLAGGRDALELSAMTDKPDDGIVNLAELFGGLGAPTVCGPDCVCKQAADGQTPGGDLAEADALVLDSLMEQAQTFAARLDGIEAHLGLKLLPSDAAE